MAADSPLAPSADSPPRPFSRGPWEADDLSLALCLEVFCTSEWALGEDPRNPQKVLSRIEVAAGGSSEWWSYVCMVSRHASAPVGRPHTTQKPLDEKFGRSFRGTVGLGRMDAKTSLDGMKKGPSSGPRHVAH